MEREKQPMKQGVLMLIVAYGAWGLLPLFWKFLQNIPSGQILAHRILWSFLFVAALIMLTARWQEVKAVLRKAKSVMALVVSSLLISSNWFIYIWAVNHDHVIDTSLGYYINPLISVALGMVVLRERLTVWQILSLSLAAVGVAVLTIEYGKFPWIGLSLALTFAFYGLAKKTVSVEPLVGLTLETFMAMPFALVYILILESSGTGVIGKASFAEWIGLICSGVVTALPLLWFARGAKQVAMSTIGFLQYLSPTFTLLLGVFVFNESFSTVHLISFSLIWCGLLVYTLSFTGLLRTKQKSAPSVKKSF